MAKEGRGGLSRAQPTISACFAACMLGVVILAVSEPWLFSWYNIDPNLSLGLAMLLIGHSIDPRDLLPTQTGPDVWVAGLVSSLIVFPLLGLVAACVAAAVGAGTEVLVGLLVMAACPPGSASNLVPTRLTGLPVAPVAVLCTLTTLVAGWTFPAALAASAAVLQQLMGVDTTQGLWHTLTWDHSAPLARTPFITHGLYSLLLPLTAGCASRWVLLTTLSSAAPAVARRIVQVLPLLAPVGILITAANKLALNSALTSSFPWVVVGVLAVHAAAYAVGYLLPWLAGASTTACRVASIQAGARNPAVGLTLAVVLLGPGQHLALAPCAVSIWAQNVLGSALAAWWTAQQGKGGGTGRGKSAGRGPTRVQPPRRGKRA